MREGVRLPAALVVIGLLAGCSDPAGAVRRQRAAARKSSPAASPTAAKGPRAAGWWQAPGKVKTANGLRVRTGVLHGGRMKVAIADTSTHAGRTIVVTTRPHGATVGHFTLTGMKIAKNTGTGTYGLMFRYHRR